MTSKEKLLGIASTTAYMDTKICILTSNLCDRHVLLFWKAGYKLDERKLNVLLATIEEQRIYDLNCSSCVLSVLQAATHKNM